MKLTLEGAIDFSKAQSMSLKHQIDEDHNQDLNPIIQLFSKDVDAPLFQVILPSNAMHEDNKRIAYMVATSVAGFIDADYITMTNDVFVAKHDKDGRSQFWKSYLSSISLTYFLKYTIDKKRPNGRGNNSFPSGHTTAAFSGAMFIQKKYGYKYGIPSFLMASFVGYSRVYADKHFWEDVVAGASIGILGNLIFTKNYNNRMLSFSKYENNIYLSLGVQL